MVFIINRKDLGDLEEVRSEIISRIKRESAVSKS